MSRVRFAAVVSLWLVSVVVAASGSGCAGRAETTLVQGDAATPVAQSPAPAAVDTNAESDAALAPPAGETAIPPARETYKGRRIAQTMHWMGAGWLMRATRESEEHASELLDALGVEPGWTVCDLGCGNGFHTLRLAERVGATGTVYGVDIQEKMLELLGVRLERAGVTNVRPVLGSVVDPKLPPGSCDLILLVDVYHELSHPERMLRAIRAALKPTGQVALVEFRAEDPEVPIKPLHKMSKAQIHKELPPNGFRLDREYDELPWQHLMLFARDDAPVREAK